MTTTWSLRRATLFLGVLVGGALSTASTCDPFPDECEENAPGTCENNVAKNCERPVPEVRTQVVREDCGAARTCVREASGKTFCARSGQECHGLGETSCNGDRRGECLEIEGHRYMWLDVPCSDVVENGICVDRGENHNCEKSR